MPSANRMTTATMIDAAEIEGRYAPLGDYTVSFETFKQDADPAPYFVGLPGDRCQCAHWGVVAEGQLTFRWPDHEETYMAGDAYYAPPGHLPLDDRRNVDCGVQPVRGPGGDHGRRREEPAGCAERTGMSGGHRRSEPAGPQRWPSPT